MSVIPEGYLEQLQYFSDYMRETLTPDVQEDANVVQKGLHLYRQGAVTSVKLDRGKAQAVVQDVVPVKVTLDLDLPPMSECTCPGESHCRHIMAAFFQLLSYERSVAEWVDAWRQPLKEKQAAKSWGLERAKDLLKTAGLIKPDYSQWVNTFRESFELIMRGQGNPKPYVIADLFETYTRRLKAGAPLKQEWKNLYYLVASVVSFTKLLELSHDLGHDEETVNKHYRELFQSAVNDITILSDRISVQALPFDFDDFIEQLKDETNALLVSDYMIEYDRIHLYCLLWTRLFKKKNWREEQLIGHLKNYDRGLPLTVAIIHLHYLLKNDDEAMTLIKSCNENITPYFFYWMDLLTESKEWLRMDPYLTEFISRIRAFLALEGDYYACRDFTRMVLQSVLPFCAETGRTELFEKALYEMLPYSFREYEDFLFEKRDFSKWMELQTYVGLKMESLSKGQIKVLQDEAPELLLPLYHQAVQLHIDVKNREHYQEAVRKLKKLRTLYKKLKRVDEWEEFLEILMVRTKRLRAFQEECKRGKLIDA
jgi:hypothetical protein